MAEIDFNRLVTKLQDEIKLISSTLKEKGSERFGRTLIAALGAPFACYFLVYAPAQKKLSLIDGELRVARETAKHADTYKDLKERLNLTYSQLPLPKDRANFLSETVKEALRAEGIVSTDFQPPNDTDVPGGVVQSLSITMRVKFPELMAFLARMEASKPLIHVNSLDVTKRTDQIGTNDVICGLSTIILTERF
jgi:hypothetical protein